MQRKNLEYRVDKFEIKNLKLNRLLKEYLSIGEKIIRAVEKNL